MRGAFSLAIVACFALVGCGDALKQIEQLEKANTLTNSVGTGSSASTANVVVEPTASGDPNKLTVCSFNIQFLGNSNKRDDGALAQLVSPYDIVIVQELVSPPYPGRYPDGTPVKPDEQSAEFFNDMKRHGFQYILSEEDTGSGEANHRNGSSTEWWVAFFKPGKVQPAADLPHGFLAQDHSNNPDFERVPYAFPFRSLHGELDFVLISVHLQPGGGRKETARRRHELAAIAAWIERHDLQEKDFIIVGDMNIEDKEELAQATPRGFRSLNDECRATNTNVNAPKPYDHVMYNLTSTTEIDTGFDMQVIDLVKAMKSQWKATEQFPGEPYNHDEFRAYFSDHDPVIFRLTLPSQDDDGVVTTATRPVTNARQ